MYVGCFLKAKFAKGLNVSIYLKTLPRICFKTRGRAFQTLGRAFEALREHQKLGRLFEKISRAFKQLCCVLV